MAGPGGIVFPGNWPLIHWIAGLSAMLPYFYPLAGLIAAIFVVIQFFRQESQKQDERFRQLGMLLSARRGDLTDLRLAMPPRRGRAATAHAG